MTTQSKFTAYAGTRGIGSKLARAVIRQIGGWSEFESHARDVASHGAASGFGGFTYYTDTERFGRKHRDELLAMLDRFADDMGEKGGSISQLAQFKCLEGFSAGEIARALYAPGDDNARFVFNALAWYALEEVSRAFDDMESGE